LVARIEAKQAIGLAQAIQIPIGLLATAGNMFSGGVDFLLGSVLAAAVGLGVLIGANFTHRSSNAQLQIFLGIALILIGIVYGSRSAQAVIRPALNRMIDERGSVAMRHPPSIEIPGMASNCCRPTVAHSIDALAADISVFHPRPTHGINIAC
jgi:hypothetical protein